MNEFYSTTPSADYTNELPTLIDVKIFDYENEFTFNPKEVTARSTVYLRRRETDREPANTTMLYQAGFTNHLDYYFLDTDTDNDPILVSLSTVSAKQNSSPIVGHTLYYQPVHLFNTKDQFKIICEQHPQFYRELQMNGELQNLTYNPKDLEAMGFGIGIDTQEHIARRLAILPTGKTCWAFSSTIDEVSFDAISSIIVAPPIQQ
jgi:hypothetical protein